MKIKQLSETFLVLFCIGMLLTISTSCNKDDEVQPPEAMETWNAWHKMLNKFKKF